MTATLVLSGTSSAGTPSNRDQGPIVGFDPIPERLGPARFGVEKIRGPQHRYEDLGTTRLAGQPSR